MRALDRHRDVLGLLALALGLSACTGEGLDAQTQCPEPELQVPVVASEVAPPREFDLAAIDTYVATRVEDMGFVGLSVAIMRGGEIVFAEGYGRRSLDRGAAETGGVATYPVDAETEFAMASNTKQFTCAAALLLAEDGALALTDPLATYYPDLTRAADITLLNLFQHTSGYADYYPMDYVVSDMAAPAQTEDLIQRFAGQALDFEPGTRWSYSNTGYLVAGRVIETVSGQDLDAFMRARLFEPLAMSRSSIGAASPSPTAATGYVSFALGAPEPAVREGRGWLHAAGGLWSTPSDLMRWDRALIDGEVLEPASFERMIAPAVLDDGREIGYGCGIGVRRSKGEVLLTHGGAIDGFLSRNTMIPRTRSAVAVATNSYFVDPSVIHDQILALLIAAEQPEVGAPTVAGPLATEAAVGLLHQMQAGALDRSMLSEEFNRFMTDARVREAAPRLAALGEPLDVQLDGDGERGGMEASTVVFSFAGEAEGDVIEIRAKMFRSPDGVIHQFTLQR